MAKGTLIFVPGFTGSELRLTYHVSWIPGRGVVWLDTDFLVNGGLRAMRLKLPSETFNTLLSRELSPGRPIALYYGLMLEFLKQFGWRIVCPDGDWRKPLVEDAFEVTHLIRQHGIDGPVYILCHSRGGLVVRRALQLLAGSNQAHLVRRVVAMGTPHTGSLQAVTYLGCYGELKRELRHLGGRFASLVQTFTGADVIEDVMRSWPAIYELLPAPGAPWLPIAPADWLYNPAAWEGSKFDPVPEYLAAAKATWLALGGVPPPVDWVNVVGKGYTTPSGVVNVDRMTDPDNLTYSTHGDGVVPVASATLPGFKTLTTPTHHSSLPYDGRLFPYLDAYLKDGLPADRTLAGDLVHFGVW